MLEAKDQCPECNKLRHQLQYANKLMQEYKKAVDESTIFSISDLKGNILYANKQFVEVSGYSLEELVGKPHSIVRDPEMPKEAFKEMWETIKKKKVWRGFVVNRRKNGQKYYVDATIVPILDDNGEVIEYAGIRDDITKLVLKEKELEVFKNIQRSQDIQKALEIKTTELLNLIPFASLKVCQKTKTITHYNEEFAQLTSRGSFLDTHPKIQDLFLHNNESVYEDDFYTFLERYNLMKPETKVAIIIDGKTEEFAIKVSQLSDGYIISLL